MRGRVCNVAIDFHILISTFVVNSLVCGSSVYRGRNRGVLFIVTIVLDKGIQLGVIKSWSV